MKMWKKNMIAAAVLIVVCAGIYVNWLFTESKTVSNLTDTLDESKIMSADMLVMSDENILLEDTVSASSGSEYFAAVRLSRQEARDSAVGILQEAIAYDDKGTTTANSEQLEQIVRDALCEAQIESLVIAKGYADCVAYISDEGISVAVAAPEGGLVQEDVAVIADIVMSQSEYTMEDIFVVEVQ